MNLQVMKDDQLCTKSSFFKKNFSNIRFFFRSLTHLYNV